MAITIASRKAKARRLQNWVAEQFSKISGIPWGKDKEIEPREMGQAGVDVKLYGKAAKLFPWSVECKAQEKYELDAWIAQARRARKKKTNWLLFTKKNRRDALAIMEAEVFFRLLEKIIILENAVKAAARRK